MIWDFVLTNSRRFVVVVVVVVCFSYSRNRDTRQDHYYAFRSEQL